MALLDYSVEPHGHRPDEAPGMPTLPVRQLGVKAKANIIVQALRGCFRNAVDAIEYYTRYSYDSVAEQRGQVGITNVVVTFSQRGDLLVKWFTVNNQDQVSIVYVSADGSASSANGSLEVRPGEERGPFWIAVPRINLVATVAGTNYRVTWGY